MRTLTVNDINEMQKDAEMIKAARIVFSCMAYEETIRPTVEAYQTKALNEIKGRCPQTNEIIFKAGQAFRLSDEDFNIYVRKIELERIAAGLNIDKPGQCPLLIAENLTREAWQLLIETAQKYTGLKLHQVTYSTNNYHSYIDLLLRILAGSVKMEGVAV